MSTAPSTAVKILNMMSPGLPAGSAEFTKFLAARMEEYRGYSVALPPGK
jgi:hypothetical protein